MRPYAARPCWAWFVTVFALIPVAGCHHATENTAAPATPVASVAMAVRGPVENTLEVAGEFVPFQEVELHAKVSGFIRKINVDIGDHVHTGEVLATLDVPELQAEVTGATAGVAEEREQVTRAQSDLARAQANAIALHAAANRLSQAAAAQPGLIAAQELENAQAQDRAAAAQVDAAKSAISAARQQVDVQHAREAQDASMESYSRITAPFDGVVTWRYADTGALIQAGTANDNSMAIVKVAQVKVLRLRLPVPESLAGAAHIGDTAQVRVGAVGKTFTGTIARTTDSLDPATRTMQVEIDVPNPKGELVPGMYANVTLPIQRAAGAITVPVNAVVSNANQQSHVLVVTPQHTVEQRGVTVGFSTPNRTEIVNGLNAGEQVIVADQDRFHQGETVTPHTSPIAEDGAD